MQRLSIGLVALSCAIAGSAHGFGTIHGLGQSAEHEYITRLGLAPFNLGPKTLSEIAGKRGSFGAVGAPDNPTRGLMSKTYAHCDGGDFLARPGYPHTAAAAAGKLAQCRSWIFAQLRAAVVAAGSLLDSNGNIRSSQVPTVRSCTFNGVRGRAKCNVLEAIGLALHAAQDFYSHTNWTDLPAAGPIGLRNPPGLAAGGPALWIDPSARAGMPAGLMSGCYDGFPESKYCPGRVKHESLNKDKGSIDVARNRIGAGTTDRGKVNNNFARAVRAAIADTRSKWAYFEAQVMVVYGPVRGRRIVCVMRRDDPGGC